MNQKLLTLAEMWDMLDECEMEQSEESRRWMFIHVVPEKEE